MGAVIAVLRIAQNQSHFDDEPRFVVGNPHFHIIALIHHFFADIRHLDADRVVFPADQGNLVVAGIGIIAKRTYSFEASVRRETSKIGATTALV